MGEPITKKRLLKYISLRMENENQTERLARMKNDEQMPAMRFGDGSQHTGVVTDRMANAIARRMEYEEKITPLIERNRAEMDAIEDAISSLDEPMEREVLRMRYIQGEYCRHMSWQDIAACLYGDNDEKHMQAIYRLHGRALQHIRRVET